MGGPLAGIRIVEFERTGPGPFAGMMLADHGAEFVRVIRPGVAARMEALARPTCSRGRVGGWRST